jgi:adenylate cyclase
VRYATPEALALAAGSSVERVHEMLGLGLLEPRDAGFVPADVSRVRLLDAAARAGIDPPLIAELVREGHYQLDWIDLLDPDPVPSTSVTLPEVAAEMGVDVDILRRAYSIGMSLSAPADDEFLREDDIELLRAFVLGAQLADVDTSDQALAIRFLGENVRRIAESQVGYLRERIFDRMLAQGMTVAEVIGSLTPVAREMRLLGDRAVQLLHTRHVDHQAMDAVITNLELAIEEAGVRPRPVETPAIAFIDLTDSTGFTERAGDEAALDLIEGLTWLTASVEAAGGKTVKYLGDGAMLYFGSPGVAVTTALDLVEAASGLGLPPVRAGLHAGSVIFRDGDYFGRTVIAAARITDVAEPGEVLVTETIRSADLDGVGFTPRGTAILKGLRDPVDLWAASRT